jgi:hypothetical protein
MELACFWFEEKSRVWVFQGANKEARLVHKDKYEHGMRTEESLLSNSILIPQSRADATAHLV